MYLLSWGPFLETPGNYRLARAVLSFILDSSFKRLENCTVKLSAKETKWTSLEVKTHPTFLEKLISKCDFGLVKLPGLSRKGPLVRDEKENSDSLTVCILQYGPLRRTVQELISANCLFKTLEDVLKINQVIKL